MIYRQYKNKIQVHLNGVNGVQFYHTIGKYFALLTRQSKNFWTILTKSFQNTAKDIYNSSTKIYVFSQFSYFVLHIYIVAVRSVNNNCSLTRLDAGHATSSVTEAFLLFTFAVFVRGTFSKTLLSLHKIRKNQKNLGILSFKVVGTFFLIKITFSSKQSQQSIFNICKLQG